MEAKNKYSPFRTAFIRVFGKNDTESGIYVYKINDILKIIDSWSKSSQFKYWLIEHKNDTDDEDKREHFHIVIKFKNPTAFSVIKNKFPYGSIETARSIKKCVQYLIHQNDSSKKQYKEDEIFTNSKTDLKNYLQDKVNSKSDISNYLELIDQGKIREYNQFQLIPFNIWVKHRTSIENAHVFFKERIYTDKNRIIQTDFIFGGTGTGKTTWVKDYCKKMKFSLCISSSSNDPFQDYKGEEVLLLDDLRDSAFEYNDFLKILDCHTKSSSKSRYHNKFFLGSRIFITSSMPIDAWYPLETAKSRLQMYRRIPNYYIFTMETISHFVYDPNRYKYIPTEGYENDIKDKFNLDPTKSENVMQQMGLKYILNSKEEAELDEQIKIFNND